MSYFAIACPGCKRTLDQLGQLEYIPILRCLGCARFFTLHYVPNAERNELQRVLIDYDPNQNSIDISKQHTVDAPLEFQRV